MISIRDFFARSEQVSPYEAGQRARSLHIILCVISIASFVLGVTCFIFGWLGTGVTILVLSAASLVAIRLNQKGHFNAAADIVNFLLVFTILYDILDAGGLGNDLGAVAFPVVIVICSLFFGKRGLMIISSLCIFSVFIIGYLDIQHIIYVPPVKTGWGDLVTVEVLLACTAILLWVILDNAEKNLKNIKSDDASVRISYELTLEGLAKTLELRDQETEHHSRSVVNLSVSLAKALGLAGDDLLNIYRGALLHDIGKLGVPDDILLKQGPLTDEEWVEMRRHPEYAHSILKNIPFLEPCMSIPFAHHERWDGRGYPTGLKGEDIPYYARIFSIVDQWEALTSDRVYRKAWPREKALAYIHENVGKIYDPAIATVFLKLVEGSPFPESTPIENIPAIPVGTPQGTRESAADNATHDLVNSIQKFWADVENENPYDRNQRKQSLNVILWVLLLVTFCLGWINLVTGATLDVYATFALSASCLVAMFFNARGNFTLPAVFVSLLMLISGTLNLYTRGGLHDIGIVAFPVVVVICGLFFGKRGLVIFSIFSGALIGLVGYLEIIDQFTPHPSITDSADVFTLVILIIGLTVLLWIILDNTAKSLLRIQKKEAELKDSYALTLEGFARALEFRGRDPQGHSARVVELSLRLAEQIGITGNELEVIRRGALLHDIGTLSIPDRILLKPGPLTPEETAEMHRHPDRARDLLMKIPYLQSAVAIPWCQHENWDGSGYPRGLKGEDIPLQARLFTIVDQWEELTSDRPFRQAWPREKVIDYIRDNSGRIYDPRLAGIFLRMVESS